MGPAFLVPMSICLLFIPLSLFLIFNFRTVWSYLALAIFICFMLVTHATSAVCLAIIIIPCVLLYLFREPKHGITLLLMGLIPFLVTLPWTYGLISTTAESLFVQQPLPAYHDLPRIIKVYGYVPFAVGLLGTFWLAFKGGIKNYGLILGLLVMVAILAIFFTLHYGVDLIYLRGMIYTLLILGIVAGAGLMAIKNVKLPDTLPLPGFARRIGYPLALALVIVVLVFAIPSRMSADYYHMIDDEDYETFVWIRDNVDDSHQKAILEAWKATPFTAITGKYVYARTHVAADEFTRTADEYLAGGCKDTGFLRDNGISIVYTRQGCSNPDLVEVTKWVYLLKEP